MSQRYFRSDSVTYEAIRLQLDAAWGLPNDKGTATCFTPAAAAPQDSMGRVLLAVRPEFCEFDAVSSVLPSMLSSGAVEEIDAAAYWASQPQSDV